MAIRFLENHLINQIAAGEVVENPASVVKELIENSLDAQPHTVTLSLQQGGQALIRITDDGHGMTPDDLQLCIERYTTSKLADNNLQAISTYGFRGEALAALGSVARLRICSRLKGLAESSHASEGWMIEVHGGEKQPLKPINCSMGTQVDVRDLFYATPARLKFLKSPLHEGRNVRMIFERLALGAPHVNFILHQDDKKIFTLPYRDTWQERARDILGSTLPQQTVPCTYEAEGYMLQGLIGLPTFHSGHTLHQLFFVNNRPVKDKFLQALLRASYGDSLPAGRYPKAILFLTLPPEDLDVNVHPAKTEVRFKDTACLKHVVLSGLRNALSPAKGRLHPASLPPQALTPLAPSQHTPKYHFPQPEASLTRETLAETNTFSSLNSSFSQYSSPSEESAISKPPSFPMRSQSEKPLISFPQSVSPQPLEAFDEKPLGNPIGQLHQAYILSQTHEGFLIIDQHAAHERIMFEALKKNLREDNLTSIALLVPEVVPTSPACQQSFNQHTDFLRRLGFRWEFLSEDTLVVRAIPALLEGSDIAHLMRDFDLHLISEAPDAQDYMESCLKTLCAPLSCRGSIKAGRRLTLEEMDALLRTMEKTSSYGYCTHGRPTTFTLSRQALDQLFQRH